MRIKRRESGYWGLISVRFPISLSLHFLSIFSSIVFLSTFPISSPFSPSIRFSSPFLFFRPLFLSFPPFYSSSLPLHFYSFSSFSLSLFSFVRNGDGRVSPRMNRSDEWKRTGLRVRRMFIGTRMMNREWKLERVSVISLSIDVVAWLKLMMPRGFDWDGDSGTEIKLGDVAIYRDAIWNIERLCSARAASRWRTSRARFQGRYGRFDWYSSLAGLSIVFLWKIRSRVQLHLLLFYLSAPFVLMLMREIEDWQVFGFILATR